MSILWCQVPVIRGKNVPPFYGNDVPSFGWMQICKDHHFRRMLKKTISSFVRNHSGKQHLESWISLILLKRLMICEYHQATV
jgi:hypothetical protein